jgi:HAD superfamily hydrolase (TIGR01509 family)
MLAGVVFDFDGVIVDSHALHTRAWREVLRSLGREVSDEELLFVREGARREEILRRFLGDLNQEQLQRYGAEKERALSELSGELRLVRGSAGLVSQLAEAKVPMAIASAGSRKRIERTLERFDLRQYFQAIVAGDDVQRGKPDPEIFLLAAKKLYVAPENILVCEDAVAGVTAAKAAGMKCLAIAHDERQTMLRQAGADWVVADFAQVTVENLKQMFLTARATKTV